VSNVRALVSHCREVRSNRVVERDRYPSAELAIEQVMLDRLVEVLSRVILHLLGMETSAAPSVIIL